MAAPAGATATVVAVQNCVGLVAGAVAPIVTGFIVEATGSFVGAFVVTAGAAFAGALIYLFGVRRPIEVD